MQTVGKMSVDVAFKLRFYANCQCVHRNPNRTVRVPQPSLPSLSPAIIIANTVAQVSCLVLLSPSSTHTHARTHVHTLLDPLSRPATN